MPITKAPRQAAVLIKSDAFLLLDENAFPHTAVLQLLRRHDASDGKLLYLYGPSGVGKSHLVRAFLRELRNVSPNRRAEQFTASQFGAELAEASESRKVPGFQVKYRNIDVLVCEDLGSLENRHESQKQLVSLIDHVLARGGDCLITSRLAPGDLPGLSPRLVNRCHAGICASLAMPGKHSRLRLINHFAQLQQVGLTTQAVELLAQELPVSPRELLAAVMQIDMAYSTRGGVIDVSTVRRYLDTEVKPQRPTLPRIATAVARHFRIKLSEMRASSRLRDQVLPRQCGMLLARQLTSESLEAIADYFGRRTHSSVIHACHRLEKRTASDPTLRQHLVQIRHSLGMAQGKNC